jgi:hypothetical protein
MLRSNRGISFAALCAAGLGAPPLIAACSSVAGPSRENVGVSRSAYTWGTAGDTDNDGLADIMMTGGQNPCNNSPWWSIPIAHSNGNGTFSISNNFLPACTNPSNSICFAQVATEPGSVPIQGDFNGDGIADIALVHGPNWDTIPIAFGNGDHSVRVTNAVSPNSFNLYTTQPGMQTVAGDFNGDGNFDLAFTGATGKDPLTQQQSTVIGVAFSNGDGTFRVAYNNNPTFAGWAAQDGVQLLAGDFDWDGLDDLALVGGEEWTTIPVAYSEGDGTFLVTNPGVPGFPQWVGSSVVDILNPLNHTVRAIVGDFNGDRCADIALAGGNNFTTIPIAFSTCNSPEWRANSTLYGYQPPPLPANYAGIGFTVSNPFVPNFPGWATEGTHIVAGDFNGDGRTDLALTGGAHWDTIPVAFSQGNSFSVTNDVSWQWAQWAMSWTPIFGMMPVESAYALSANATVRPVEGGETDYAWCVVPATAMSMMNSNPPMPMPTTGPTSPHVNPPPPGPPAPCSNYCLTCPDGSAQNVYFEQACSPEQASSDYQKKCNQLSGGAGLCDCAVNGCTQ